MARRMARRGLTRGGPKRGTFWEGNQFAITRSTPAAGPFFFELLSEALLENVPNPTIVRTYLSLLTCDDESVSAPDSFYSLWYGIGVFNSNAATAGVASLPTPLLDASWDGWLFHGALHAGSATSGVIDSPLGIQRIDVESKAMRKVGHDQIIALVIEPFAVLGTEAFQLYGGFRMLLKK